ncbi:MAG: peptide-methionine (S)-S-oxide reductase [Candidatus Pelagibacterales bacterium]|nr:MAG: peptide-methionine (S)-S-oxide reductase [Pelagibacterales bacterium]
MKKLILIFLITIFITSSNAKNIDEAYFAGGCFWCVEEFFEKTKGVKEVISGYSGGNTTNPTYKEVTYGNTGHFEAAKIIYDADIISYKKLLSLYWQNIDPFDSAGQFCDKGLSYRSVAFYKNQNEKKEIENSIKNIEKKFKNKKVVTFVKKFNKFYPAEDYHQDYYQENFMNYLLYKKACGRKERLKEIWENE